MNIRAKKKISSLPSLYRHRRCFFLILFNDVIESIRSTGRRLVEILPS